MEPIEYVVAITVRKRGGNATKEEREDKTCGVWVVDDVMAGEQLMRTRELGKGNVLRVLNDHFERQRIIDLLEYVD